MKIQILKDGVTDGRAVLDVGVVLDYDTASANALIAGGWAKVVPVKDEKQTETETPTADVADTEAESTETETPTADTDEGTPTPDKPKRRRTK